jgi:AcrR family transcriptional regulator
MASRLLLDRPDLDKSDTRTRIMIEAERLFRHYGYGKTTVADIARELGMSPANIYRFFESKGALMQAMAERILADRTADDERIVNGPGSAAERLRGMLLAESAHSSVLMNSDRNFHEMVAIAVQESWDCIEAFKLRIDGLVRQLIAEGVASGEFPRQDVDLTARCVNQAFVTWCHPMLLLHPIDKNGRATPDQLIDFILDAVRGRRPGAM